MCSMRRARHGRHPEVARRLDAAMAGQDAVLPVDQEGIGEAEPTNAFGDLADLLSRMSAGIARPGAELANKQVFNQTRGHKCWPPKRINPLA